jgi:branched-chain amino acid transport system permease protein
MSYKHFIGVFVAVVALVVVLKGGNGYQLGLVTTAGVFAILGLSLNLVYGYLGYISFGHAAFFGLGGYAAGLLSMHTGMSLWTGAIVAMAFTAILGILIGLASLRLGGAYFAIASLTAAEVMRLIADNWIDLTRGPMGLIMRRPKIHFLESLGLSFDQYYLIIVWTVTVLCFLLIAYLMRTTVGRAWLAVREGRDLAESIGIDTLFYRVLNLALSGMLAGLAGSLLVPRIVVLTPDLFGPTYSAMGLLIVVLGGKGTLIGPLIGGALFAGLPEALRFIDDYRLAVFAVLLLLFVRVRPQGLSSLLNGLMRQKFQVPPRPAADNTKGAGLETGLSPDTNGKTLLEVKALRKNFSGVTAVKDVSFDVKGGEIFGIMGPNGAGKSTCLAMLTGFLSPTEGGVFFKGRKITGVVPNQVAAAGMVRTFQHSTLFENLCVFENVMIATHSAGPRGLKELIPGAGARAIKARRIQAVWDALALVGLTARAADMPRDLPYGEQRRLSLAIALAVHPTILLLDEPAAGLNPVEAEGLAGVLRGLRQQNVTIILVEHNVKMMSALCDRILVVNYGERIALGTPTEVQNDPGVQEAYFGTTVDMDEGDSAHA